MYIQALYIYWFTTHDKHDCIYNYHSFILQKRRPSHKRDAQAGFKPRLSGCIVLALHHGAPRELSRVLFPHPQPPSLYQQKQISEDHPIQVLKRTWVDISTWKNHFYSFFRLISKGSGGFFFFLVFRILLDKSTEVYVRRGGGREEQVTSLGEFSHLLNANWRFSGTAEADLVTMQDTGTKCLAKHLTHIRHSVCPRTVISKNVNFSLCSDPTILRKEIPKY